MANIQSAMKRNRQRLRRRERNKSELTKVRTQTKRVASATASKDAKSADYLKTAVQALDKAAQKGVIKRKTASRKISRLTKAVQKLAKK